MSHLAKITECARAVMPGNTETKAQCQSAFEQISKALGAPGLSAWERRQLQHFRFRVMVQMNGIEADHLIQQQAV